MQGRFLSNSNESPMESNIYADRSSVVLAWLLMKGIDKGDFSLRGVAKECGVSIGLVQRVFHHLVSRGFMLTDGVRTAKRFIVKRPEVLLRSWLQQYSIIKKCKIWTFRSALSSREKLLKMLRDSELQSQVALALHSAAEARGYKNTNLTTLELYLLTPGTKKRLEKTLDLEPQEKGYEVLLVEPYYKSFLKTSTELHQLKISPSLLTFLDLYHFPLRGLEQAEYMAEHIPELKRIYKKEHL